MAAAPPAIEYAPRHAWGIGVLSRYKATEQIGEGTYGCVPGSVGLYLALQCGRLGVPTPRAGTRRSLHHASPRAHLARRQVYKARDTFTGAEVALKRMVKHHEREGVSGCGPDGGGGVEWGGVGWVRGGGG
jgi:hypothetical protein